MRGFDGTLFDRESFKKYLAGIKPPTWVKHLTLHSVSAPNLAQFRATTSSPDPKVDASQRDKNFWGEVQRRLAGKGWHLSVFEGGWIADGCDITKPGAHANSWNAISIGLEMVFDGDSNDPLTPAGQQIIDTAAYVFAQLFTWLKLPANATTIRYHNEEASAKKKGKTCPGRKVESKDRFILRVQSYLGEKPVIPNPYQTAPTAARPTAYVDTPGDTLNLRDAPNGNIKGTIPHGTALKVVETGTWSKVRTPAGYVGYVGTRYISTIKPTPKPKPSPQPSPPPTAPAPTPAPSPPKAETNPQRAVRLMVEHGWRREWACGAVGNLQRESYPSLRADAQGDWELNGNIVPRGTKGAEPTAFGIGQWRNDRKDALDDFAETRGKTWVDFDSQVLFVPHEVEGATMKLVWKWLQQATTVEQATAIMVWYERPRGYIPTRARAATTWDDVFAVSVKCDGYKERLAFAKAL